MIHSHSLILQLSLALGLVFLAQPVASISHVTPDGYYRCNSNCYDINRDCRCDDVCDFTDPFFRNDIGCSASFAHAPDHIILLSGGEYAGYFLPTLYIVNQREVYINEEKGLFIAWTNTEWAIGSSDSLQGAIYGHSFPVLVRNNRNGDPSEGWNGLNIAAEAEATVQVITAYGAYHPDENELFGFYHLSAHVLNGRGVFVNEVTGRFLGYNGQEWVIEKLANLYQLLSLPGIRFSGFRKSNEGLRGVFREQYGVGHVDGSDYWTQVAETEQCEIEHPYSITSSLNRITKCLNKCTITVWQGFTATTQQCSDLATCVRFPGGMTCDCDNGYAGIGEACTEVDECAEGTHNCDGMNAQCINTEGSFTCSCNNGWESVDEGVTCTNVDECLVDSSVTSVTSTDCTTLESVTDGDTSSSSDYADCGSPYSQFGSYAEAASSQYDTPAFVILDLGSVVSLSAVHIWQYYADRRQFAKVSVEVSRDQEDWQSVFSCSQYWECGHSEETGRMVTLAAPMQVRYVRVGSGRSDQNIVRGQFIEIQPIFTKNMCDVNAGCTDTEGSYTCECNHGYVGDGSTCDGVNVDECAEGTHTCDMNARCIDTDGSFTCLCNDGWQSVDGGVTCTNVDECNALGVPVNWQVVSTQCTFEEYSDITFYECGDSDTSPAFLTLDIGSVVSLTYVHIWQFYFDKRQYQQVSVEVSQDQEVWESVFSCDTFSECGSATSAGRSVQLTDPTPARYVRIGSGRNSRNTGRGHFLDFLLLSESKKFACGENSECVDTVGSFTCECDPGFQEADGECENLLERRRMEVRAAAQSAGGLLPPQK